MEIKDALRKLSESKRKKALSLKGRIETLQKELENLLTEVSPGPVKRIVQTHKKVKQATRKKIGMTLKAGWSRISGKKAANA